MLDQSEPEIQSAKRDAVTPEESLENLENEINSWLLGYEPLMTRSTQGGTDGPLMNLAGRPLVGERKKRIYSRVLDIPNQNFLTL